MAVSKRLRFEIFRRDNHARRYCGAAAPDVRLTVDHVIPAALGGADAADNLVTACADCNSGKTSVTPDAPIVDDVAQSALEWAAAIRFAAAEMLADHQARRADQDRFLEAWAERDPDGWAKLHDRWRSSVDSFIAAGLPLDLLLDAVDVAFDSRQVAYPNKFRYMCGVVWARVGELQTAARQALEQSYGTPRMQINPDDPLDALANDVIYLLFDDEVEHFAEDGESPYAVARGSIGHLFRRLRLLRARLAAFVETADADERESVRAQVRADVADRDGAPYFEVDRLLLAATALLNLRSKWPVKAVPS